MKRRGFLQATAAVCTAFGTGVFADNVAFAATSASDPFVQPPLPYSKKALLPFLSEEQMTFHYEKHHAGYFKNLKNLLDGKPEAKLSLEELIVRSEPGAVFNNAAQAWNHTFFWNCMAPQGTGGVPSKKLADALTRDFESVEKFLGEFQAKSVGVFGSGWGWLAADKDGKLKIMGLSNADTPLKQGLTPLLVVDVWEHAYYVDYRNDRAKFAKLFADFINWDFASKQFEV